MDKKQLLPDDFLQQTRRLMGEERLSCFLQALEEDAPVSIRLNPMKLPSAVLAPGATPVPWCSNGYWLPERPNFTFDPLFHAGCYYAQEAASMFVHHVLDQLPTTDIEDFTALDLCAAPGGKSTAMRSVLPADSLLVSNEPVRQRAQVLAENVQKWGYANHVVTNNYPRDFRRAGLLFDLILCDVPCSGEGMFRKDPSSIAEWSLQNVERCWRLQRDIVADAWQCLRPGGTLIYSTCTYNIKEDEENIRWMMDELGAEPQEVDTPAAWHVTGSLLPGFTVPVYRFIPGITRTEGLFVCVLRKSGHDTANRRRHKDQMLKGLCQLSMLCGGEQPPHAEVLSTSLDRAKYPTAELDYATAIAYLRREAITLPPDMARGLVVVTFQGHPLGLVKNIGSRANNLYPKEWAIRSTHLPSRQPAVVLPPLT